MKENIRTQHKYSIIKLKKTLHLTTALAFFLQQLVPYSSVFAMESDDYTRDEVWGRNTHPVISNREDEQLQQVLLDSEKTEEADVIQATIRQNASEYGIFFETEAPPIQEPPIEDGFSSERYSSSALTVSPPRLTSSPPLRIHHPLSKTSSETSSPQILTESPPLRIRPPVREIPSEVMSAPLSTPSVIVQPQVSEESEIFFSEFTAFPLLDEGLDELSQLIIRATNAEKDLPFDICLVLEKALQETALSDLQKDTLKKLLPRLLPPEELLLSFEESNPLITSANLTSDHPEFRPLILLIEDLKARHAPQETSFSSPVLQALGDLETYYVEFLSRFCKATSEERRQLLATRARMCGERIGAYFIPQETARALLSKDRYGASSRHNNNQEGGQNAVYAKGGVHFKAGESSITDIDPAMEWALHAFTSLFAGIGLPYPRTSASGFLSLENILVKDCVDSEEARVAKAEFDSQVVYTRGSSEEFFAKHPHHKKYFTKTKAIEGSVQASRTSGEMSLGEFLREVEEGKSTLLDLNSEAFEDLALVSLITVPSDAKDDNIRVFRDQMKMVSIDNDRAFADMIVVNEKGRHSIEGKNVLFLMKDLMEKTFSKTTKQKILNLNPVVFMLDWIKALQDQEKCYHNQILHQGKQSSYFPLKYTMGLFWTLLTRLETIQAEFRERKILTPHSLLNKLFPIAATYYKVLRDGHPIRTAHPTDLHYAQQLLYGGRGLPDASVETLLADQLKVDADLRDSLARETALPGDSVKNRTKSLDQELMDFLDHLSTRMTGHDAPGNNTLLHFFAQTINKSYTSDFITFLLKKGIPLESENDAYETPLDLAMVYQNGPAFFALVNAGAGKRLQKAQTAETFYKKFALGRAPEAAQYQQAFEALRTRSALINGMFIRHHFFQNSTQSPIELAEYGPQALSQEAWDQLFDQNGVLKAIDPDATRKVGLIDLKGCGLFFKQYPALPGIETALDILTLLLFYRGVPYTALANIKGIPYLISEGVGREEQAAPPPPAPASTSSYFPLSWFSAAQASDSHPSFENYKRNNLAYVLKHTPERLKDVDEESLSEAILMAMLTGQEDGKPNNFMLQPIPEKPGKWCIVPIDNDQAFVPEVSYPSPTSRQKGKQSRVQVKSVLFCLDQMTDAIHPSVVEVLVHLNPEKLLKRWLEKLSRLTQEHQALFTESDQLYDFWNKHETYIGVPFQKGDIQEVYFKLMKMQDLLKLKPYLTHLELLKEVLPFVYHRYHKIFNRDKTLPVQSVDERFIDVDGEAYGLTKGSNESITLTSSNNIFEAKKIKVRKSRDEAIYDSEELPPAQWQAELTQAKQAYEEEAKQLLLRKGGTEITNIMNGQRFKELKLDLSRRSAYEQSLLFATLDISDLEKFSLILSSELNDKFFERVFPSLRELDIRGCPQLTNGVFSFIMQNCSNLRSLNLAKNTALTKITKIEIGYIFTSDTLLRFNDLEVLNISECSTLQQVSLHAPKLQHLRASECPSLSEIQLTGVASLKTLDLRNAQSLPLLTFNALLQGNHSSLAQVQTEGAINLPTIPKMPFQHIKFPFEEDNLKKVGEHLKKATENKDPEARYQLAEMYAKGQGVKQNLETALEGYRMAAEKGHKAAQSLIEIVRGHEDIYTRFLKGRLIYKPNEKNDEGKIELRIADLANPLEGEFDLSKCGDAGKYLSINTGYRKSKRPENKDKVEIWFSPHFLIKKNLQRSASHFKNIMGSWDTHTAPVGTFFTWGGWDDLSWYDYALHLHWDAYNDPENNLSIIFHHTTSTAFHHPLHPSPTTLLILLPSTFTTQYPNFSCHF